MFYKKKENVRIQEHEDYALLLDPDKDRVLVLSLSAAFILDNCSGLNSLEDLERKTLRHFSLPIMRPLMDDVKEILIDFEKEGVVELVKRG